MKSYSEISARAASDQNQKKKDTFVTRIFNIGWKQFFLILVLTLFSVIVLFPLAVMILLSSKSYPQIVASFWRLPTPVVWENYTFGFKVVWPYILNSLIVSGGVLILTLVIATFAAHALSRIRFAGKDYVFTGILGLILIPAILILPSRYLVMTTLGLTNSYWSMIIIELVSYLPMPIFLLWSSFSQIHQSLFDSARIDGAGELSIIKNIVVPLSLPMFSTVAIMNILSSWNEFIWPLILVKNASLRTVTLGLFMSEVEYQLTFKLGKMIAAYAIGALPLLIAFFILLKPFMKGLEQGATKG